MNSDPKVENLELRDRSRIDRVSEDLRSSLNEWMRTLTDINPFREQTAPGPEVMKELVRAFGNFALILKQMKWIQERSIEIKFIAGQITDPEIPW